MRLSPPATPQGPGLSTWESSIHETGDRRTTAIDVKREVSGDKSALESGRSGAEAIYIKEED